MTNQEIFDIAVNGLASQGFKQSKQGSQCVYNGPNNTHCAIGWLLDDVATEYIRDDYNDLRVDTLFALNTVALIHLANGNSDELFEKLPFLCDLQTAHDGAESPEMMQGNLKHVADKYGLECSLNGPTNLGPNGIGTIEYSSVLIEAMDKAVEEAQANA